VTRKGIPGIQIRECYGVADTEKMLQLYLICVTTSGRSKLLSETGDITTERSRFAAPCFAPEQGLCPQVAFLNDHPRCPCRYADQAEGQTFISTFKSRTTSRTIDHARLIKRSSSAKRS